MLQCNEQKMTSQCGELKLMLYCDEQNHHVNAIKEKKLRL